MLESRHLFISSPFMQMQLKLLLPFLLIGYKCIGEASSEMALSSINHFCQAITSSLKSLGKYLITLTHYKECLAHHQLIKSLVIYYIQYSHPTLISHCRSRNQKFSIFITSICISWLVLSFKQTG